MRIDRSPDLGRSAKRMHDTGEQRFDDLVAQDEVGAHGPVAGTLMAVTAAWSGHGCSVRFISLIRSVGRMR
jgi:hypothetical protein